MIDYDQSRPRHRVMINVSCFLSHCFERESYLINIGQNSGFLTRLEMLTIHLFELERNLSG